MGPFPSLKANWKDVEDDLRSCRSLRAAAAADSVHACRSHAEGARWGPTGSHYFARLCECVNGDWVTQHYP